jgi:hypothetical protein
MYINAIMEQSEGHTLSAYVQAERMHSAQFHRLMETECCMMMMLKCTQHSGPKES